MASNLLVATFLHSSHFAIRAVHCTLVWVRRTHGRVVRRCFGSLEDRPRRGTSRHGSFSPNSLLLGVLNALQNGRLGAVFPQTVYC